MTPLRLTPELWQCSTLPQGILQRWLRSGGTFVEKGEPLALVQIEGNLHKILAPDDGWLTLDCPVNAVIDPGTIIGHLGNP